jgi:Histidine kinase
MVNPSLYRTYHIQISRNHSVTDKTNTPAGQGRRLLRHIKKRWPKYTLQLFIWVALFYLPLLLFFTGNVKPAYFFSGPGNSNYLVSFTLLIIFSYFNYYWLVPKFYLTKAFLVYFLFAAVFLSWIIGLQYPAGNAAIADRSAQFSPEKGYPLISGLTYTVILFMASMSISIINFLHAGVAAAEKETKKMKLSLLNAQINPHFLFNSLNWIYYLAVEDSAETPQAIMELSGLMRYVLKEANEEKIDIRKELDYIKNYIALQKGRLGDTVLLNASIPFYKGTGKIAPLLAMSFIENAFKYGVNPDEDAAINIEILIKGNKFCLQVINNKVSAGTTNSNGVGIENARQRLNQLYPGNHHLEILEDKKIYAVKLLIHL